MIIKPTVKLCVLLLITFSLSACQINKHTTRTAATGSKVSEVLSNEDILLEDEVPEHIPGARHIEPAVDLSTNPTSIGKFKGNATRKLKNFYNIDHTRCRGFMEPKPALIFDKHNATESYRISAQGDIDFLFIEFSDREILCQRRLEDGQDPVIELTHVNGRAYKIYGGRFKKHAPTDFALTFENLDQPLNVNWLDTDVQTLTIDSDLTPPRFLQINAASTQTKDRKNEHGDDSCTPIPGNFDYALEPAVRLEIQQPAAITAGIRTNSPAHMTLVGPIPEDRREIPTRCLPTNTTTTELAAGTYYIRLGLPTNSTPPTENIQFFVHGAATALDPLTHFEKTPQNLPVAARALDQHYPFLETNVLLNDDSVGQKLFSTTPPQLYVVATENLTTDSASIFLGEKRPEDTLLDDARTAELPQKDELLLLLNSKNIVLAADGSLFVITQNLLKPAEQADVVTVPTTARNPQTFFRNALLLADESDQGRLEQYTQRMERYEQCVAKTVSATHAADSPHVAKTCGFNRLNDENKRFWRQLEDSRTERRNNALNIIRARLADLVLVK